MARTLRESISAPARARRSARCGAALLIPGLGPFIAGGALFAALTGAAAGAVVGGIAGALIDTGLSEDEARRYETMVHEGKTLVAVKARDEDTPEVRRILASAGA